MGFKGSLRNNMDVVFCLGACCSGKTTYSLNYAKENENTIRFSLDEFKIMCFGNLQNDKLDEGIMTVIYNMIINLQMQGKDLIIDGFPLDVNQLKLVSSVARNVEIILFDISHKEAIIRNSVRRKLGGHYVKPTEMERYYNVFTEFIESEKFLRFTLASNVTVQYINNGIKQLKNESDYVL